MAFSELELKRIEQIIGEFCRKRSPAHLKDKLLLVFGQVPYRILTISHKPSVGWIGRGCH